MSTNPTKPRQTKARPATPALPKKHRDDAPQVHRDGVPQVHRDDAPQVHRDDVAGGAREAKSDTYVLRLYVAGKTPNSIAALDNLKKICDEHLAGRYKLQVVDLLENPQLARGDQILAIPTLVRKLPLPVRKIIGDLSNTERVLVGLDLRNKT